VQNKNENYPFSSRRNAAMYDVLNLLSELSSEDINWLFENGTERQVIANTLLIAEGAENPDLFFVLDGLVGVEISSAKSQVIARLGPGELLGELSFIEKRPASASIKALENSLLLMLTRQTLEAKLEQDTHFAARFFRACAVIVSRRLREGNATLNKRSKDETLQSNAYHSAWARISKAVETFKEGINQADKEALRNHGEIPAELQAQIRAGFQQFAIHLNEQLGKQAPGLHETIREEVGARLQREILPYILLTKSAERVYSKPRGYAGDFLTIDVMYRNKPEGVGRLGALLDQCFHELPAAAAVRNRRGLLAGYIQETLKESQGRTAQITSLACGPAAEIFDTFETLDDKSRLYATLIDIDLQALAFVSDKASRFSLTPRMNLINGNLVYLATGRQQIKAKPQDLVYSIGLIDYFNDKFVILLLNYIHKLLRPGGKVLLGNFHPKNPTRAMMDYILDWKLIHRSEEDMNRLFETSDFGRPCTDIRFEPEGVNLFAECIKQDT
jgi:extracellular factor (EF) 3-hydroxypalmitic acid methyl ester biosynthesis protein